MPGKKRRKVSGDSASGTVVLVVLIVLILVIDRLTKIAAEHVLSLHETIPVIRGVFHFTLVHNTGAAFGLFRDWLVLLVLISAFVLFLLWYSLIKAHSNPRLVHLRIPLALVFSGALGNLIDRIFLGHVIDFLDFRIWPVFNIADSAITIGAVLLALVMLKDKQEPARHASPRTARDSSHG